MPNARAIADLARRVRGGILSPGDEGYDDTRKVWNAMVDKHPRMIARCTGPQDVIACLEFAREHDVVLSVRGGGHNLSLIHI